MSLLLVLPCCHYPLAIVLSASLGYDWTSFLGVRNKYVDVDMIQ
jgi:hypothetical protein